MAQTEKGIIYPYDYNEVADVPSDFKALAESIDALLNDYSLNTDSGNKIVLEMNNTTYKIKAILKDKDDNVICTSNEIDLPLENMVTNITYNNQTLTLTHQDGQTTEVSIADLISDLASKEEVAELQSQVDDLETLVETELDSNTVEGTEIDVSDSAEYRGRIEVKGNTEQEQLSGKNLFDYITNFRDSANGLTNILNADGSISVNGTPNSQYTRVINETDITDILKDGTTYIASQSIVRTDAINVSIEIKRIRANESTSNIKISNNSNKVSFTVDKSEFVKYTISFLTNAVQPLNFTTTLQLEEGSTATDYEQYCGGQPSPNSSFPQNIEVVTGDNVVKHVGKNLLNLTSITTNTSSQSANLEKGLITISWDAGFNLDLSDIISNLDSSKIYTISFKHKGDALYLRNKKDNSTNILGTNVDSNYTTYSLNLTNINEFQFRFVRKSNTGTAYIRDIQIEQGSTATPYEPYRGEEYKLDLWKENEFNSTNATIYNALLNDAGFLASSDVNKTAIVSCQPNKTYKISKIAGKRLRVAEFNTSPSLGDAYTNRIKNDEVASLVFKTSGTANYLAITYYSTAVDTLTEQEILNSIQIQEAIELCKIGDNEDIPFKNEVGDENYNAELEEDAWYKKGAITKAILNGTEPGWGIQSINSYGIANFYKRFNNYNASIQNQAYINYFSPQTSLIANETKTGFYLNYSRDLFIRFDSTVASTVEAFKTWLSTHNLEFYYVHETPIYEKITNTTLISQLEALRKAKWFKGVNHWWTETENLEPNLKGTYKQSNNLRLQALEQAVVALGGV